MKHCIACGGKLTEKPLLTLDHMPAAAQDIPDLTELDTDGGITLNLCRCRDCGLVQFDCEPVAYYREVIRAGGFSTTMVELRRKQYRHLIETYNLEGKRFIEIGCGRGEFLSVLTEFPVRAYGIEYRDSLVELAGAAGLNVWKGFAGSPEDRLADSDIPDRQPPYDVFLSFNFLEHQPDPSGMLRAIYENLADDGMGLITVPSFEYILEHDGYYELIRDHLAYYTFESLRELLERNGFEVLEEEMVNRDTIAMIVHKRGALAADPERSARLSYQDDEKMPGCRVIPDLDITRLLDSRDRIDREVNEYIDRLTRLNKSMALWGASHQGFTLAATTGLGKKIKYIIDSAPFKQGRYAPASHLPIVPPDYFEEDPVDAVLIVAPGYTDEIADIIRQRFAGYNRNIDILTLRSSHIEQLHKEITL